MRISPTAEGFRLAIRRPSLTLAEITWRWGVGITAAILLLFGGLEYLDSLRVTAGERLLLSTRHPYLVAQAIAHILRGSLNRVVLAGLLAALMLGLLWIVASSLGRVATVPPLVDYFRHGPDHRVPKGTRPFSTLVRLNFLRTAVALAAIIGLVGAAILAGLASSGSDGVPGTAFLLFAPLAALVCLAWFSLNWLLSLAGMFAARDGHNAAGAISAAVSFCRERTGAVFAVSTWTGLAHLIAFVGATTVVSMPLGLAPVLPWRLLVLCVIGVTMAYFAVADWLYMARLAGYVCIAEMPQAVLAPIAPTPQPRTPPLSPPTPVPAVESTIDREELILSDVPNPEHTPGPS
jgi:hypothetical protein